MSKGLTVQCSARTRLYSISFLSDYHWEQFDKNVTKKNIVGDWTKEEGLVSGLVGFGKAINLVDEQVRYKVEIDVDDECS